MKKLFTTLLAITTVFTIANTPIYADYDEPTEPETYEFTMSALQWEGMSETIELEDGGIVEVTISDVQDVPQPRSVEELGHGTWTRYINYKYTNPESGDVFEFGWTFKVTCPLNDAPYFPREPYNIVRRNCNRTGGPAISQYEATPTSPARMRGSATAQDYVAYNRYVELHVTCDYYNILRIGVTVA